MARSARLMPRIAAATLGLGVAVMASLAPLSSANAENDWNHRNWQHNGWDHRHWSDNRVGGGFYVTTPGYYYNPPPVYYPPPPVYYAPAPAPYYGPSFGFSIHVH
jgi:hypothetical protein